MVFTTAHSTPLYSSLWTPENTAAYAATCMFLIALSIANRLLYVWRRRLEHKWLDDFTHRRYVLLAGESEPEGNTAGNPAEKSEAATLTARGLDEKVRVLLSAHTSGKSMPWSFSVDVPRACIFTLQGGVGYLL